MTTGILDPVMGTLIRIGERVSLSPGTRELLRSLLQTMYQQGREDGKLSCIKSGEWEEEAREQGWSEPA